MNLEKEENGVEWSSIQRDKTNVVHVMQFEGQELMGSWCAPRAVFRALASMSPEVRAALPEDHDECMHEIRQVIQRLR